MFKGLEKVFDIIGEILAVIMVIVFALLIINANFDFLPDMVLKVPNYLFGIARRHRHLPVLPRHIRKFDRLDPFGQLSLKRKMKQKSPIGMIGDFFVS